MSTILNVTAIRKSYGAVEVLRGVDLNIAAGERVALMGPSGCGKSTLLNCLCGIDTVDHGTIQLGEFVYDPSQRGQMDRIRREWIGYVFQSFHLLPTLSALENVELPGSLIDMPADVRQARARALLQSVGLANRQSHLPDSLSGGERQRVALARAVMHRPQLILADEPTGSLDSASGAVVLDLLQALSVEHGIALLLVTHDADSTRICDRVLHMRDGCIEDEV